MCVCRTRRTRPPEARSFPDQPAGVNRPRLLYHYAMQERQTLLEFPCDFPIKAMGRADSGFEVRALEIVRRHAPDFSTESMRSAASRQGNYLSYTFVIRATSRAQLDALYRELSSCDELLMVL